MNNFQEALEQYAAAHHILYKTYPAVDDEKLLLGVINNLLKSVEYAMVEVLEKNNHLPPKSFEAKFNLFRNYIPQNFVNLINDLQEIKKFQKNSPVDFRRQGKFVMCGENYNLKYLQAKDVQHYLEQVKDLLDHSLGIKNRKA